MYAFRYASDGEAPTLHHSPAIEDLYRLNPAAKDLFGDGARAIVSEPLGAFQDTWSEVPQSSMVITRGRDIEIRPFRAQA